MSQKDPYALPDEERLAIVDQQLDGFRRELYGHELNLVRLDALPEEDRDASWQPARDLAVKSIATIKHAIDSTLAHRTGIRE